MRIVHRSGHQLTRPVREKLPKYVKIATGSLQKRYAVNIYMGEKDGKSQWNYVGKYPTVAEAIEARDRRLKDLNKML